MVQVINPNFPLNTQVNLLPGHIYRITPFEVNTAFNYKVRGLEQTFGWSDVSEFNFFSVDGSKIQWLMLISGAASYNIDIHQSSPNDVGQPRPMGPNLTDESQSFNENIAGGTALTEAWKYTVPENRQAVVQSIEMDIIYQSGSASGPNASGDFVQITKNGIVIAQCELYSDPQEVLVIPGPLYLQSGDVLVAQYQCTISTDGAYVFAAAVINETDA
jgi:hypothetical protein